MSALNFKSRMGLIPSILKQGGGVQQPGVITPVALSVPQNYSDGALIYRAQPVSGSATGYSVPAGSGFAVDGAGYVTVTNSMVALAGLPKSVDVTISKTGAPEVARLNLTSIVNYLDLSPLKDNIDFWVDALDNRFLQLTGDGQTVQEVSDKVNTVRKARNDLYTDRRPILLNSPIDASRKAIRFAPPNDTAVYGLFFQDAPISDAAQRLTLTASTIQMRHDLKYKPNTPGQAGAATSDFPNVTHSLTANQPALLTIVGSKSAGSITFFKNGTQLAVSSGWTLNSDFVTFTLIYPETVVGQVWSNAALGQGHIWKQGAYKGYLCEAITILGATVSA